MLSTNHGWSRAATTAGLAVALVAGGCGREGPSRGAVRGRVTLGGTALPRGRILFLPQASAGGPAVSAVIREGNYELSSAEGPIVGENRVEVEAEIDLGFAIDDEQAFARRRGARLPANPVPPQFNTRSTLSTKITAGENVYDVAIPAPRRR